MSTCRKQDNIIKLPSNADYETEKVLNVLLHAATSTSNSLESASNDLKRKNPETKIPSSDTILIIKLQQY